jgi:phosphoribosyl-dephospho-CoA transferase
MLHDAEPAVHALLRVTDPEALIWDAGRPPWAEAALQLACWAVVRRAAPRPGLWPVGVRGGLRSQRAAAWLPHRAAGECMTPQCLAATWAWRGHPRATTTPAVAMLDEVAAILATHGFAGRWGPGGSVGFELASGLRCTTPDSDLDLVLSAELPVTRTDAVRLHTDLSKLPVRIDTLLETPRGAAALAEYARGVDVILLRSAQGPRLVRDPWTVDGSRVDTQ